MSIGAPAISTLGATSGILSTIAYYGYRQHPITSNRINLAGDCTVIPGEGFALIATPGIAALNYIYERGLRNKGEHPEQLQAKRLKDLQTLDAILSQDTR